MSKFSENLIHIRESHGMSEDVLAHTLRIPVEEYRAFEAGDAMPTRVQMEVIAATLGVDAERIIYGGMKLSSLDTISDAERDAALAAYREAADARYEKGRRIVLFIVITQAILTALDFLTSFNLLTLVLNIVFLVLLWRGKAWVQWFYIIVCGIQTLIALLAAASVWDSPLAAVVMIGNIVYSAAVCILLFASPAVHEFLYTQETET